MAAALHSSGRMMDLLASLESTDFASWLRESASIWGYPTVLTLHTLGMGVLVGASTVIDVRLLGAAPGIPLEPLTPVSHHVGGLLDQRDLGCCVVCRRRDDQGHDHRLPVEARDHRDRRRRADVDQEEGLRRWTCRREDDVDRPRARGGVAGALAGRHRDRTRHHVRDRKGSGLRLSPRSHRRRSLSGRASWPPFRDRGRGGLHPHRRSTRSTRDRVRRSVTRRRPAGTRRHGPADQSRDRLHGRRVPVVPSSSPNRDSGAPARSCTPASTIRRTTCS